MSIGVNSKVFNGAIFPVFILITEQGKEDPDTRLLRRELLHDLDTTFDFFKGPLDHVGSPNVFPAAGRVAHLSEALVQVLHQAIDQGRED